MGMRFPCAAALAAALSVAVATGQGRTFDVKILPVQGFDTTMVYMLVGAGANIVAQVGDEGVVLVDTGVAAASDAVLRALRTITDKPIRYIINTHAHEDHVGGNDAIVKTAGGQRTDAGGGQGAALQQNQNGVMVFAHQNTVDAMLFPAPGRTPYPEPAVARSSFITADKQLHFNGEAIELWWHPNAHTNGDIVIYFPRSDVVVAGDLLQPASFPVFDADAGGRLQGILNGLNQVIDLAVPRFNQIGGTRIVPGHGWLCTESDVVEARDMGTIVRDRVQHLIQKGLTLEQTSAARPLADYEPVYGATTGPWTTTRFLEAVYADLRKPWDGPGPVAKSGLNFIDGGR